MNDAALKILIDSLEAHRSSLDAWLGFWTWLVVIGIVFDVLFVIHAYQGDLHEWRRGILSPPSRPSRRWYVFELFAVVLVALGVAGELAVEGTIGRVETQIRTANDQRASLLQQEAGDAKESSKSAADAAARAKNEADAVGKVADQAQAKIASVGKRAGQLDAQVGMTQYLLSARRVQDGTALANALRPDFKGRSVFLTSYAGDQEAWGLCTQLWYITKSAEMEPVNNCGGSAVGKGALISPLTVGGSEPEAQKLFELLVKVGRLPYGATSTQQDTMLTIFVGVKPSVIIGETEQTRASRANIK